MPIPKATPEDSPQDRPISPPGFARAAEALRAKIRACAARSFAARQGAAANDETPDDAAEPALLAGRAAQRSGSGRVTGRL